MPSIFFSYAHQNREVAQNLASLLSDRGYNVWWDRKLRAGQRFSSEIQKQIKRANHVVVLLSPDSISSRWVNEESNLAAKLGKLVRIIINNLEICEVPDGPSSPLVEICDPNTDLDRLVKVLEGDAKQIKIEAQRNAKWRQFGTVVSPRAIRTFGQQGLFSLPLGYLSVAFASDGRKAVSGGGNGDVIVWNVETGREDRRFATFNTKLKKTLTGLGIVKSMVTSRDARSVPDLAISAVTWSADDSYIVAGSWDASIRIWDAAKGTVIRTLQGHPSWVFSVDLSPDGHRLVSAGTDRYDEIDEGNETIRLERVAAGEDRTLMVWDVETGSIVHRLGEIRTPVYCAQFSPDGRTIASSIGGDIKVWETESGREIGMMLGHEGIIYQLAFSHDGSLLASAGADGTLKLWNVVTGTLLRTFFGHAMEVKTVALTSDNRLAVSGGVDSTVRVWDVESGHLIRSFIGHNDGVLDVDLAPNDATLISASQDGTLKLWDLSEMQF